jgi:mannose-6-phosphate isomerase-like protein (cupin superfamily)
MCEENIFDSNRPWGYYVVLANEQDHKIKRIVVLPGKRISLQRHKHRSEHWHMINGTAKVTLDNENITLTSGESLDIPQGSIHRIENTGTGEVVIIEVQRGDYFGEDDIERFEDDFGRKLNPGRSF